MNEDTVKFIEWYHNNIWIVDSYWYGYDIDNAQLTFGTLIEVYEYYLTLNK